MKKIILPILIISLATFSAFAATNKADTTKSKTDSKEYKLKDSHKDLTCTDCHGDAPKDQYYLIKSEACLSCHGSREDVAALTKDLDAGNINPHRSFHSGTVTECYECHREHKPSRNYCGNCHDTDIWMKPVP